MRPPLERELNFQNIVLCEMDEHRVTISENINAILDGDESALDAYNSHSFTFDQVYSQESGQKLVYDTTAKGVVDSALQAAGLQRHDLRVHVRPDLVELRSPILWSTLYISFQNTSLCVILRRTGTFPAIQG